MGAKRVGGRGLVYAVGDCVLSWIHWGFADGWDYSLGL